MNRKSMMNRTQILGSFGFLTTILLGASSLPVLAAPAAAPTVKTAAQDTSSQQDLTIRYVCFVATPNKVMTPKEVVAANLHLPALFDELQDGSPRTMDTTPIGFIRKLDAAGSGYTFQILLSGTAPCVNGDERPVIVADSAPLDAAYQPVLNDQIYLTWNSPTSLTLHHTGTFVYTKSSSSRGGPGWIDMHTDKIQIGRVYTQGIDPVPDGRMISYAFCVLPGKWDKMASAWIWHKPGVSVAPSAPPPAAQGDAQ